MNLGKQLKAIRRELLASPKKAAVLGVLLVAAVYFWGPIVWRLVAPAKGGENKAKAATKVAAASTPTPALQPAAIAEVAVDWNEVRKWRKQDPLTLTAVFDPTWPDPFPIAAMPLAGASGNPAGDNASSAIASAIEAGLVLESVVYGKTWRAAIISGEIYREGDEVVVEPASGPEITFTLRRIERRSVELTDPHGRVHLLAIPLPKLADTDRIEGSQRTGSEDQNQNVP